MQNGEQKPLEESILESIKAGRLTMRPQWYFALRTSLLALGALLLFITLLYFVSFIVFYLRETGALYAPQFPGTGIMTILRALPWIFVAISALFIIVLQVLVRRYSFGYRRPILYSLILLVGVLGAGGLLVAPLHLSLFRSAQSRKLPIAGPLYRGFMPHHIPTLTKGTIVALGPSSFVLEDIRGGTTTVLFTSETRFPTDLSPGTSVVIFGRGLGSSTQAFDVRIVRY